MRLHARAAARSRRAVQKDHTRSPQRTMALTIPQKISAVFSSGYL